MHFIEYLFEVDGIKMLKPKPHPRRSQWYKDDVFWRANMHGLYPDAKFIGDEENEEVFAVSPNNEDDCYGVWRYKEKHGVSFPKPRSLRITAKPRAKFSDYQLP